MDLYEDVKAKYEQEACWGMSTSIDIQNCDSFKISDEETIKRYVKELCEKIDMKRFGETQVIYFGQDIKVAGFSMIQFIETSLISGHFANETNAAYLDIFSCKPYDPYAVSEFSRLFFGGSLCSVRITYRK